MAADLTARIRAKLDEVRVGHECASITPRGWRCLSCEWEGEDRENHCAERVADLVRRMMEDAIRRASFWPDADVAKCAEAALAVPSEEEERG